MDNPRFKLQLLQKRKAILYPGIRKGDEDIHILPPPVLQYCEQDFDGWIGGDIKWKEWQDVPIVMEGE